MSPSARVAVTRIDETTQNVSPTFTVGEPNYGFNTGPSAVPPDRWGSRSAEARSGSEAMRA